MQCVIQRGLLGLYLVSEEHNVHPLRVAIFKTGLFLDFSQPLGVGITILESDVAQDVGRTVPVVRGAVANIQHRAGLPVIPGQQIMHHIVAGMLQHMGGGKQVNVKCLTNRYTPLDQPFCRILPIGHTFLRSAVGH